MVIAISRYFLVGDQFMLVKCSGCMTRGCVHLINAHFPRIPLDMHIILNIFVLTVIETITTECKPTWFVHTKTSLCLCLHLLFPFHWHISGYYIWGSNNSDYYRRCRQLEFFTQTQTAVSKVALHPVYS